MLRNLGAIKAHETASFVSLVDFIIIKKYPIFVLQSNENEAKHKPRHVLTSEAIYYDLNGTCKLRKVFKVKVADTLLSVQAKKVSAERFVSLYDMCKDDCKVM